jgi:DNA gyrase/topoisomerase IV subunit B
LFVGEMPLFSTVVKGKFIPLYTREDMEKYKSEGYPISRIKGLGEMKAEDLAVCAFDEETRNLIQVTPSNRKEIEEIWASKSELTKDYIL